MPSSLPLLLGIFSLTGPLSLFFEGIRDGCRTEQKQDLCGCRGQFLGKQPIVRTCTELEPITNVTIFTQITVWATVFTLPYLYYDANLGPKTGFVYTGLCFVSLAYVYFCVGEVTGRSMEDISGFFANGIPAQKWKDQPWTELSTSDSTEERAERKEATEKHV